MIRAARAVARGAARRRGAARPTPWPWRSSTTAKSESPQTPSRTSAMRHADDAPVALGDPRAAGIGVAAGGRSGRPGGRGAAPRPRRPAARRARRAQTASAASTSPGRRGRTWTSGAGTRGSQAARAIGYPARSPWPSRSRSSRTRRTHKRRSQHKVGAPDVQRVPDVPQPAPPAPGLPGLRQLRRARGRARPRRPRPRPRPLARRAVGEPSRSRVDANGADLGPAEVAAGAALAAGRASASCSSARPSALGAEAAARPRRGRRRAGVDRQGARSGPRRARHARRLDRPGGPGRRRPARPTRSSPAAPPAPRSRPALFNIKRARGHHRPALASPCRCPSTRSRCSTSGANAEVRAEHLVQFAFMGAALHAVACSGSSRPRVGLLSNGEEATKGTRAGHRDPRAAGRRVAQAGGALRFVGNVEGTDVTNGAADVVVTDGFTGNIVLKLMEGVSQTMIEAVRDAALASPRGEAGRPAAAPLPAPRCATASTRSARGRLPARPAQARRRAARPLHPRRDPPGDPAGGARRGVRRRRPHARGARGRGGAAERARGVRRGALACPRHDPRRGAHAGPRPPGRRARRRPGSHRRGHALQGGPRGRLARPLHARAGARGPLRRAHDRRAGGARSSPWARPSTSSSPTPRRRPELAAPERPPRRAARGPAPPGVHARLLDRAALGLLRAAGLPGRQRARPGRDGGPLPAPGGRALRRRAPDEDPRPDRLGPVLPGRRRAPRRARAPRRPPRPTASARRPRRSSRPSACWPR